MTSSAILMFVILGMVAGLSYLVTRIVLDSTAAAIPDATLAAFTAQMRRACGIGYLTAKGADSYAKWEPYITDRALRAKFSEKPAKYAQDVLLALGGDILEGRIRADTQTQAS
jgi:hypothetical protein